MDIRSSFFALALASLAPAALAAQTAPADGGPGKSPTATNRTELRLQWNLKTLVGDYDRIGARDVKWDKDAREALEGFARVRANPTGNVAPLIKSVAGAAQKAVTAGCTDPMVGYLHARYVGTEAVLSLMEEAERYRQAAKGLASSEYHNLRKAYASLRAADAFGRMSSLGSTNVLGARIYRGRLITNVIETARDSGVPADELFELCGLTMDQLKSTTAAHDLFFVGIEPHLLKHWGDDYRVPYLKARAFIEHAWRARGTELADKVGDEKFKLFEERLTVAGEALRRAWKMNSQDAEVASLMLRVQLGLDEGREEMEKWFQRAMDLDPANYMACKRKMYYLEPKWHGSAEDMLAFGRECVESRKWTGAVPLVLPEAHETVGNYLPESKRAEYWMQPQVWKDVQAAFDKYFANPNAEPG